MKLCSFSLLLLLLLVFFGKNEELSLAEFGCVFFVPTDNLGFKKVRSSNWPSMLEHLTDQCGLMIG